MPQWKRIATKCVQVAKKRACECKRSACDTWKRVVFISHCGDRAKKKSFEDEHLNLCTYLHKDQKHTKTVDYAFHSNFPFFKSCIKSVKCDKNREKSPKNSLEKWSIPNSFPAAFGLMESSRPLFLPPSFSSSRSTSLLQSYFSFHTGSLTGRPLVAPPPSLHAHIQIIYSHWQIKVNSPFWPALNIGRHYFYVQFYLCFIKCTLFTRDLNKSHF